VGDSGPADSVPNGRGGTAAGGVNT